MITGICIGSMIVLVTIFIVYIIVVYNEDELNQIKYIKILSEELKYQIERNHESIESLKSEINYLKRELIESSDSYDSEKSWDLVGQPEPSAPINEEGNTNKILDPITEADIQSVMVGDNDKNRPCVI